MANTKSIDVIIGQVYNNGVLCANPVVQLAGQTGVALVCKDDDAGVYTVEVLEDQVEQGCLTFIIQCAECDHCDPVIKEVCLCDDVDDCGDCEACIDGVCESICEPDQFCDNGVCVDCITDDDCICDQQCINGSCGCPTGQTVDPVTGCCNECSTDEDCEICELCQDGDCVPKVCVDGFCDPLTGDCVDCYESGQCSDPNECCEDNTCVCCEGYVRINGICVPTPECWESQDCIDAHGPCHFCDDGECKPTACPPGFALNPNAQTLDDDCCVPSCGPLPCPPGEGCINGVCIPCEDLSCITTEGLQCAQAVGCGCNAQMECEAVDCDLNNVSADWIVDTGSQGTVISPGEPPLTGSWSITPETYTTVAPIYMNFDFHFETNSTTGGTWRREDSPGNFTSLGTGTSVDFDLTSTGPNLIGFIVHFTETSSGRTARFAVFGTPSLEFTDDNRWNNSNVDFTSTGTSPTTTGGTPGSIKLCVNNANFDIASVATTSTTGDISIFFSPDGPGCMFATITGCGTWNGEATLECGGVVVGTVPVPEFTRDPSNCCDPTDSDCDGWGTGDACDTLTLVSIDLINHTTFGDDGGSKGESVVQADWTSAGLSFMDLFYLDISPGCWTLTDNAELVPPSSSDITLGGGPTPDVSPLAVTVTYGVGGCVQLGHGCELTLPGCLQLQGEVCMNAECEEFSVRILDKGSSIYSAGISVPGVGTTYQWYYPDTNTLVGTGSPQTIVTQSGDNTITLVATRGACTATATLNTQLVMQGCTDAAAANYDPDATNDDGSCVKIIDIGYLDPPGGFDPDPPPGIQPNGPELIYKISGTPVNPGDPLDTGDVDVDIEIDGIVEDTITITVPTYYSCVAGVCVPQTNPAIGQFKTINCDNSCTCNVEINAAPTCTNNQTSFRITATGDTGVYTVVVQESGGGSVVLPSTPLTDSTFVDTPLLCNGNYTITVTGATCDHSITRSAVCYQCSGSTLDISADSYDCVTNTLTVTVTEDICADDYTVQFLNSGLADVIPSVTYLSGGTKSIPVGVYAGDGTYTVRVTAAGCTAEDTITTNCLGGVPACTINTGMTTLTHVDDGVNIDFNVGFNLTVGGDTYSVDVYETTASGPACTGGSLSGAAIASTTTVGVLGANAVSFASAIPTPGADTCYRVVVQNTTVGQEGCNDEANQLVSPVLIPVVCAGTITNTSYDTATQEVLVSWDFVDTSADMTVNIFQSATAVCTVPGDPLSINESGHGEDGLNVRFPIAQLDGQAQCLTITIFDTADPTCTDTVEFTVPACTCAIDSITPSYSAAAQEMYVDWTASCTTVLTDLLISIDEHSNAGCTALIGGITTRNVNSEAGVETFALNHGPDPRYMHITIEDTTNAACILDTCFTIPANPDACPAANPWALEWDGDGVVDYLSELTVGVWGVRGAGDPDLDMTNAGDRATLQGQIDAILEPGGSSTVTSIAGVHRIEVSGETTEFMNAIVTDVAATGFLRPVMTSGGCGSSCDRVTVTNIFTSPVIYGCGALEDTIVTGIYVDSTDITGVSTYDFDVALDRAQFIADVDTWLGLNGYTGTTNVQSVTGGWGVEITGSDAPFTYVRVECSGTPGTAVSYSGLNCTI